MNDRVVFRWLLDVDSLWPSPPGISGTGKAIAHWASGKDASHALSLLAPQERTKVLRYYHPRDAKLSLRSCLLKRRAIANTCKVAWADVVVSKDKNRKPCYSPPDSDVKGLEFNVSHHGSLVALVGCSDPSIRLGVDIVQVNWERDYPKVIKEGFESWAKTYEMAFSDREIKDIAGFVPSEQLGFEEDIRANLRRFYTFWCLKEAFCKMTGEGLLASWLKDLEFRNVLVPLPISQMHHGSDAIGEWGQTCNEIEIWFHGSRLNNVKLEIQAFKGDYMIATASSAIDVPLGVSTELDVERDVYP